MVQGKKLRKYAVHDLKKKKQNVFHPKVFFFFFLKIFCAFNELGCMLISEALIYTRFTHYIVFLIFKEKAKWCICKSNALILLVPYHNSFLVIAIS